MIDVTRNGWRLASVLMMGFASGLPLALTGATLQAWLTRDGLDPAQLGMLTLLGLPYTFKFLWAPLLDRFEPPWFGRRRGWIVIGQLGLAASLFGLSSVPTGSSLFVTCAALVALFSASQDVVIDAWRTDLLPATQRGLGGSLAVLGYRLGMIVSGGVALAWADPHVGGWSWPVVYQSFAFGFLFLSLFSGWAIPPVSGARPTSEASGDLVGFVSLLALVAAAWALVAWGVTPLVHGLVSEKAVRTWLDVAVLLGAVGLMAPLAWWLSRAVGYVTLVSSLQSVMQLPGAIGLLAFLVLYKLGDAFAGALATPFLLGPAGFGEAEVGVVSQVVGLWLTILGALVGGVLLARVGLFRALLGFGVLQLLSNFGFLALALGGKGTLGVLWIPVFDLGFVAIQNPTGIDLMLLAVVAVENVSTGLGTAAIVAFMMAVCDARYSATQYALLSALTAVGRVWVGPVAGGVAATTGWTTFFVLSALVAVPGLVVLVALQQYVEAIDQRTRSGR
jgi:PAT family beta-lactamase induction signal transducer AmpG